VARLAYLGTPDMAVPPLRALVDAGHDIALCVTRPDRRRGRGKQETPSPVKVAATALGLPVTHDMNDLTTAGVELAVVVACLVGAARRPSSAPSWPVTTRRESA
jgi:methionyl-tRNA formyltransferase